MALDAEAHHGLAGRGDAVDHLLGPAVLDADHYRGSDIGIGARADQRAEMQVQVGAELQPPVRMRMAIVPLMLFATASHRAFDRSSTAG